jgi:glycosyltransferase involved in cell wall biosynthesis
MPLAFIARKTKHAVAWIDTERVAVDLDDERRKKLLSSDIIVLGRPITPNYRQGYDYIQLLRSEGAKVVYETDDDLTEVYRDISDGKRATCVPYLPHVDAITCTTEPLAKHLAQFAKEVPIYVLPNHVEPQMFRVATKNHKRKYPGTRNIMLIGTRTHGDDWRVAYEAISKILNETDDVRLLVGGFHPLYIPDESKVELLPFVPYSVYPTVLAEADIIVAAIEPDDPFNASKSAVKVMEGWAASREIGKTIGGAAMVATKSVVYNDTIQDGKNGLLVDHTVDAYYEGIKKLLDDEYFRMSLQRRGSLDVVRRHNIGVGYRKWVSAYTKILRS